MNSKETYKAELIQLIKKSFPQMRNRLIFLIDNNIPLLQIEIGEHKHRSSIHPRIILEAIEGNKLDELKTLAEYCYNWHKAAILLNQYLGNTIIND